MQVACTGLSKPTTRGYQPAKLYKMKLEPAKASVSVDDLRLGLMEAQSHGWDQQGNPWYTQPVSMTYTTPNISGDGGGGAFTALLDKKVQEATEAMRMEMNSKLFGKPRGNPELRKCIADAVDQHMPAYRTQYKQEYPPHLKDAKPKYKTATEAAIMTESKAQLNRVEANLIYGLNTNNINWANTRTRSQRTSSKSPRSWEPSRQRRRMQCPTITQSQQAAEKRKEAKAEAIVDTSVTTWSPPTGLTETPSPGRSSSTTPPARRTTTSPSGRQPLVHHRRLQDVLHGQDRGAHHVPGLAWLPHVRGLRCDVMEPPKLEPKTFTIYWSDGDFPDRTYSGITGSRGMATSCR